MAMPMFEMFVVVLLLAGAYFVGRLVWLVAGGSWIVASTIRRQRALLAREIAGLSGEQIRERLVGSPYFNGDVRRQPPIEEFLSRIARHDELSLRRQYSRRRLYSMLSACERAAGGRGRPEAVDYIDELYALLDALAQRAHRI
jgi:hypothetical protein